MEHAKNKMTVSLPELGLIAGTRGMLGCGIGLLLANRLNPDQRRAAGLALVLVGIVTTIPLGLELFGGRRHSKEEPAEPLRAAE